jgi:2-aminoethylphosphonate-pyruvate transaminase
MGKSLKLFTPGPVNVSDEVRKSLIFDDIGHRESEFEKLFDETTKNLLKVFHANEKKYKTLLITGSGTCANETVLSSVYISPKKTLILSNGEFGERLAEQATRYGHSVIHYSFQWGKEFDLIRIQKEVNFEEIGLVGVVALETSTGFVNSIENISKMITDSGENILFFVDAVSALAAEDIYVDEHNIDFCTSSAGKAIGAFPGVSMICLRKTVIENILKPNYSVGYLNLFNLYDYAKNKNQTPHTPAVQLIRALNRAIERYLEIGEKKYKNNYKKCNLILTNGLKEMGLKPFLSDKASISRVVSSFYLPEGMSFDELKEKLFNKGYLIYGGKKYLKEKKVFQVANMGCITENDCYSFLKDFKDCIHGKS